MQSLLRTFGLIFLLLFGVALWQTVGQGWDLDRLGVQLGLIIGAILAFTPPARNWLFNLLERVRHPSPRRCAWTALSIGVAATAYLLFTAYVQGRDFFPRTHDEFMHMLQVRMLAHGKLWTAAHLHADFFESFHILVKPKYASIYFPGTALLYAPTIWLHIPYWLAATAVCGAAIGMLYRVVTQLLDGLWGAAAALMFVSLPMYRYMSLIVMSHTVMALLGVTLIWACLHWRDNPTLRWAGLIGALGGWAAITRPVDALCYCIPIGIAMLCWLRRQPIRRILLNIAVIFAAAVPFLSVQLIFNRGVTGQWLKTPYRVYCDMFTPQMSFGFHKFDPNVRPQTTLRQRIQYYNEFTVPVAREHTPEHVLTRLTHWSLPTIAMYGVPAMPILIFVPLSLIALRWRRLLLLAPLVLYITLYCFFAYLLPHYVVAIAPAVIFSVVLGAFALETSAGRGRAGVAVFSVVFIIAACLGKLHEINPEIQDDIINPPVMRAAEALPAKIKLPAIVLFRYQKNDSPHFEPVYNLDVVNPDDAPMIRANDLGAKRNAGLFRYYAQRQPQRTVYLFVRSSLQLYELGNVQDLASAPPSTQGAGH